MRYLVVDLGDVVADLNDETSLGPRVELYLEGVAAERAEDADEGSTITFIYPDEMTNEEPRLTVGRRVFALRPEVLEHYVAGTVEEARPLRMPTRPASEIPFQSSFPTRVQPRNVRPPGDTVIAGIPGAEAVPVNAVATKETSHYLAPAQELRMEADWVPGWLFEFETYWEPLGWALDQWVDTLSLGPFEDTLQSLADTTTDASARSGSVTSATDRSGLQRGSSATAEEAANCRWRPPRRREGCNSASPTARRRARR